MASRFVIGIDLGTTNSAVSFVDTAAADARVRFFAVPQLVAPGSVAARSQVPSFVYLATEIDLAAHETALPWTPRPATPTHAADASSSAGPVQVRQVVGELARAQGARLASRMISSAKSWLCHAGVDREAAILPWGDAEGAKLSPVAASAAVLRHIREAWDFVHRDDATARFVDQAITVTVPASFDEAARELTLRAIAQAGYPEVSLLEEPQAAFYAWLEKRPPQSAALVAGAQVLVCDVGGGTTDFTLITVAEDGQQFMRTAVGDHVLLGGDNIDLALAKQVEQRVLQRTGKKLDSLQWHGLVHACRLAKEQLLGAAPPEVAPIVVAGRGAKLIGGTLRDEIARTEVLALLLDGFFPLVAADAPLARGRAGLVEYGLPYAADPAITRHLANFLARHHAFADGKRITAVLFNGGAMTPVLVRERVLAQLAHWQQGVAPLELPVQTPELAVADGAAYYGLVRRGLAARIGGGTARSFYVGVQDESAMRLAVCVAPKGQNEGERLQLPQPFELVTNRPVSFRLYSSSSRNDALGAMVPIGDGQAETLEDGSDLLELPPIVTVLRARGKGTVSVRLETAISELGALEVHCVGVPESSDTRWKLEFDLRAGGAAAARATAVDMDAELVAGIKSLVSTAFAASAADVAGLNKKLEGLFGQRREDWSMAQNRAVFDALVECAEARKRSAEHEQRWLALAGFALRPGVGASLDAWRCKVMWGVFNENVVFAKAEPNRAAWWIVWRRIAGGLSRGQQEQIFDRIAPYLLPNANRAKRLADSKLQKQEVAEMWRVLASLERLPLGHKTRIGDELMARMTTRKGRDEFVHMWALARVGSRVPLYGPLNAVLAPARVAAWLGQMWQWDWTEPEKAAFALAQLGRRTGDRARDLDDAIRAQLLSVVQAMPQSGRAAHLIAEIVPLDTREELVALGDSLPVGLRLPAVAPSEAEGELSDGDGVTSA